MKKMLLISSLFCFSIFAAKATTWTILVSNFQFSPATVSANVGDTILWQWSSGGHTTTSTSVPTGAATWDHPMTSSATTFKYVLTVKGTYQYWCTIHAPQMAGVLNVSAALPVTLSSFNASLSNGNSALINWSTASEQNTAFFSLQKSNDGSHFTQIAKLNAAGNSATQKTYSFTDNNMGSTSKYVYYMLGITDKNGHTEYSKILMLQNTKAHSGLILSMAPNPITLPGHLMLQFNADVAGSMLAKLYNNEGKLVTQTEMSAVPGVNNGHFHIENIPAGIYTIVFSLNGITETKKIIIEANQ
jgi:plastocyanin